MRLRWIGGLLVVASCVRPARTTPPVEPLRTVTVPAPNAPELPLPGEPVPIDRITLQTDPHPGRSNADPRTLRRLLAWRGGMTELALGYSVVNLSVKHVVDGEFTQESANVVLLGEAAHVAPEDSSAFGGTWTVQRLPDGLLIVDDIEDTPFRKSTVAHRKALRTKIAEGLASRDPTYQMLALASLLEHRMVEFVPQVVKLLDSEERARSRPWLSERHGTVGELATLAISSLTEPVDAGDAPGFERTSGGRHLKTNAAQWEAWWSKTLAADPFPRVESLDPEMAGLQVGTSMSPALFPDPRARRIIVERAEPTSGGFSHALLDVPAREITWLRSAAGKRGNSYGEVLAAAWTPTRVGVLTGSIGRTPASLFVANLDGSVVMHRLARYNGHHAAIAPHGDGWLLAYTHGGEHSFDSAERRISLQPLDANGRKHGRRVRVDLPSPPHNEWHADYRPIAIVATDTGFAVAVETDNSVAVVGFDRSVKQRWTQRFGRESPYIAIPHLATTGDRLLLQWKRSAYADEAGGNWLSAASMNTDGTLLWREKPITSSLKALSQPAATDDGWVLAWVEFGKLGPELKASFVSASGQEGETQSIARVEDLHPLTVSVDGTNVVFHSQEAGGGSSQLIRRTIDLSVLRGG